MNGWTIEQLQQDPVPVGTVVSLTARPPASPERTAAKTYVFGWRVKGPFHTSNPEDFPETSAQFDWDTAGLRAGVYWVTVNITDDSPSAVAAATPAPPLAATLTGPGAGGGGGGATGALAKPTPISVDHPVQLAAAPTSAGTTRRLPPPPRHSRRLNWPTTAPDEATA